MIYTAITVLLGILLLTTVFDYIVTVKPDPREPRFIAPKIPVIGHLLGLLRSKQPYFIKLRQANPSLPIYGLSILGSRVYVVNSTSLAVAVQRNAKNLSLVTLAAQFSNTVFQLSRSGSQILLNNIREETGGGSFSHDFISSAHSTLAHGPVLNELTESVVKEATIIANGLTEASYREIELAQWVRRALTLAASNAVYGPGNPLADKDGESASFDFVEGLTGLLFFPKLLTRKADEGRTRIVKILTKYIDTKSHLEGSEYIRARLKVGTNHGLSVEDTARMELAGLIALLPNANAAAFWFIINIYSRPTLLQGLRGELEHSLITHTSDSKTSYTLDITRIKERCPLFVSTFQETLRVMSLGTTSRLVLHDTIIGDRYLLKKDAIVMVPSVPLHTDPELYGPDAEDFNAYRFAHRGQNTTHKLPQGAYRTFGGGSSLCPGRHFAATEVFALVGLIVLRYDITPVSEDGAWKLPEPNMNNVTVAIPAPEHDIRVKISERKDFKGDWKAIATPLTTRFDLAAVNQ